jgi:two-component system sensor histidine kinase and response regulator WspE
MSSGGGLGDFSLMELFRAEVETQAGILSNGLLALEADPASRDALDELMRASHSIKGAARIVNLEPAVHLAHAMEDCFEAAKSGKTVFGPDAIDTFLKTVDFFSHLGQKSDAEVGGWLESQSAWLASLKPAIAAIRAGKAPVPATAPSGSLGDFSMFDLFRVEVETQANTLNTGLLALEATPDSRQALDSLMRAAHSIKGAARIVGLDIPVTLAHAIEDCFEAAKNGEIHLDSGGIDVLLQSVDTFVQLSQKTDAEAPAWLASERARFESLQAAIGNLRAGKVAPPATPATLSPPPGPSPSPEPEHQTPSTPPETQDRAIKVTAESLDRLMGLAAETLVETRQLAPVLADLMRLKAVHSKIGHLFGTARQALELQNSESANDALERSNLRLEEARQLLNGSLTAFENYTRQTTNLADRLYREVIGSRMRPFADATQGFPRLVRDVARKLGKKVHLEILGRATEVDRDILQKLEAPLNHLIRNAMDHGIELPADRLAARKPEEGLIKLEARHRSGMLVVTVGDDGRGVDLDRLRKKVVEKELTTEEMLGQLTEQELLDFLFLPGFSTAAQVTEISGRGVGLDVVQSMVHDAGGAVRVLTKLGKGTSFQLSLPITRSVIRALLTEIGGEPYAFPLARIEHALALTSAEIQVVENRQFLVLDGQNVGLISAAQVLSVAERENASGTIPVIVVSERNHKYGLVVDRFLGERELVVRPLDPRLGKVPDLSSVSILEDGTPIIILDVEDVARSIDSLLSGGGLRRIRTGEAKIDDRRAKRILVVDDSITVREVERKLLENQGYEVEVAVDGMEGWNAIRLASYDLLVTDVDMPRMNGIELVKRVKADPHLRDLPIMIVSYKDREEDRLKGLEAGANYYLTKSSFHDEKLAHAVRDLIGFAKS